ncbi:MAG: glycine--tRNA ligase subunit beta [Legionellales bacterium]|nr:glycine--tRNA ligase subunit beta [Legionellales bacterium]|tara:strand:- start:120203 stop:122278 length:2076 start_codon:yes stop_codon:yes gene_type:complete
MSKPQDFLVEIGCEELPPKALRKLADAFHDGIVNGLNKAELEFTASLAFATPRRLAVLVTQLQATQADRVVERKGPAVKAAFDQDGNPTPAVMGFVKSCGVDVEQLERRATDKGEWLYANIQQTGKTVHELMPDIVNKALKQLPIPKPMRWGNKTTEFVRPVHWALMLYGSDVIAAEILGQTTGNQTYGHRFHHPQGITVKKPADYGSLLEKKGHVIADYDKRRSLIQQQATALASKLNGNAIIEPSLLDEVTGIVEWPVGMSANFAESFLDVPQQALISAMQDHQKCFPVVDGDGKLLPHFITISNIDSSNKDSVIHGNERVMAARLADAEFFYQTDLKLNLNDMAARLSHVVFQAKLGTLEDKCQRLANLGETITEQLQGNVALAKRAGELCKADLVSDMVGEFPELQGIMGEYYALNSGEPPEVAKAIREHYLPRFAGDDLPTDTTGCAIAIADRIDTIVGIIGINKHPTGERDPFALRRAALGLLRIMIEGQLDLDLKALLEQSVALYGDKLINKNTLGDCFEFIIERLRTWYHDQDVDADTFAAVLAKRPSKPLDFHHRIMAVVQFRQLPEATALAAANKRVSRILIKDQEQDSLRNLNQDLFAEQAEISLASLIAEKQQEIAPLYAEANYSEALTRLATLREPVDNFFDNVMVNVEDKQLRNNRLALLASLRDLFLEVADISLLQ